MRKNDLPDNLWVKCPRCEHMLFHRDLEQNQQVCHQCHHHFRLTAKRRFELLFDSGRYTLLSLTAVPQDPLRFKDTKKYADRLKDYRHKTNQDDAVLAAVGLINGINTVVCAFDFNFMGGSMGMAAGQALLDGAKHAVSFLCPLVVVTSSGGARMHEGILSLMQMPRTILAVGMVKEKHLPYIVILADPTTGGVSASFAMLGDVAIAEPGAIIGFAGARVIEETIKQKLPEGFQKAEYLLKHGMIDMVVPRQELTKKLGIVLALLMHKH